MTRSNWPVLCAVFSALAGCASLSVGPAYLPAASVAGRFEVAMLSLADLPQREDELAAQSEALIAVTQKMVTVSTGRGLSLGALAGCGTAMLALQGAQNCFTGAAKGAAIGALAGRAAGEQAVATKFEPISATEMVKALRRSDMQLGRVQAQLGAVLAAQDAELAALEAARDLGEVPTEAYAHRRAAVAAYRSDLAQRLTRTAQEAKAVSANLNKAEAAGQSGLAWHRHRVANLERNALSARAEIRLF